MGATVCLVHVRHHPRDMGATEIKAFPTHLAIAGKVSASIRNPAKSALRFLYRQVLRIDEPWQTDLAAVRQGKRLPGVLTVAEVSKVSALWLVVGDDAAPKLFFQAGICRISRTPRAMDTRTFAARRLHSARCVPILPPESSAGNRSS
ncbi:MAG: phage integrase N-terminal SAM-like domain-containing protein [Lysobacterales bacterium]